MIYFSFYAVLFFTGILLSMEDELNKKSSKINSIRLDKSKAKGTVAELVDNPLVKSVTLHLVLTFAEDREQLVREVIEKVITERSQGNEGAQSNLLNPAAQELQSNKELIGEHRRFGDRSRSSKKKVSRKKVKRKSSAKSVSNSPQIIKKKEDTSKID